MKPAPVYIHAIETAVPAASYDQTYIRDIMKAQPQLGRRASRIVGGIYNASGIAKRHIAIPDFVPGAPAGPFYDPDQQRLLSPNTKVRNELYTEVARELFPEVAARALAACEGIEARDVTHVVTVSCTGFYAPGPDYSVVRALGLSPGVQRLHIGFMGCYAAFPALRAARAFCEADPDAVVLVVCAELCSLHMRVADDPDTLIAGSVFADGAGAAIVSAREPAGQALRIDACATTLTPVGEADMAWTIGDAGFEMTLSTYVPAIVGEHIGGALAPLLNASEIPVDIADVRHWAIHPGGRSILDNVQTSLGLSDDQLCPSREVLRDYGNMSSATVLFILKRLLQLMPGEEGERVCAMAFGPGLTVETALLTKTQPVS